MSTSMVVAGVRARMARMVCGEMLRPAVGEVVAVDRGDDDVSRAPARRPPRATFSGSAGSSALRQPGRHVAEGAGARAGVAHDHHGGVALRPALADVGAGRLLAHRDEPVLAQDRAASRRTAREAAGTRTRIQSGLAQHRRIRPVAPSRDAAAARLSRIVTMTLFYAPVTPAQPRAARLRDAARIPGHRRDALARGRERRPRPHPPPNHPRLTRCLLGATSRRR